MQCLSESCSEDGQDNAARSSVLFRSVGALSGDSGSDRASSPELPACGRKRRKKRKRQEVSDAFKKRLSSKESLKNLLLKSCTKCKRGCLQKFKGPKIFENLVDFRKDWISLDKLDQDRLAFDRMKAILQEAAQDGTLPVWKLLGISVCLKAWKRLHAIGSLVLNLFSVLDWKKYKKCCDGKWCLNDCHIFVSHHSSRNQPV